MVKLYLYQVDTDPELCVKIGSSMKSQHARAKTDFEIFGVSQMLN